MSQHPTKTCPNCRAKEITSFSNCRFCGTRYDAVIEKNKPTLDATLVVGILATILIVVVAFNSRSVAQSFQSQYRALTSRHIEPAAKPRLIEFYTNWQGCAVGAQKCAAYTNLAEQCQAKYGNKIDFQILNADDENNAKLLHTLAGPIAQLPVLYLFNREGQQIAEFKDRITYTELDKYLRDPEFLK